MKELNELLDALEVLDKYDCEQAIGFKASVIIKYREYKAAPKPLVLEAVDTKSEKDIALNLAGIHVVYIGGKCYRLPKDKP